MAGNHAARRRLTWLPVAFSGVLAIGAAAAVAVISLQRYVDGQNRKRVVIERLHADAHSLSTIEWQAIAAGAVDSDTSAEFQSTSDEISASLWKLGKEPAVQAVVTEYVSAVRAEMALISAGQFAEAIQLDAERVDPAFRAVDHLMVSEQTLHASEASRAARIQMVGGVATIAATVVAIGGVMWRLRRHEMTLAEQSARLTTEARFRSLVQNSSDMITVVDANAFITYESPSSEAILGRDAEELTGTKLSDLVHPDDSARIVAFFNAGPATEGSRASLEARLRHADGSWRMMQIVASDRTSDPGVGGFVLNIRDVTDRKNLEDRLRYRAFHDPLTTLANRLSFTMRLQRALAREADRGGRVAVLFLDLDDFKSVNDVHGHPAGDALLIEAGMRLRACLRPEDTLARFGGDEFAVLLEEVGDVDEARNIAGRILGSFFLPFSVAGVETFAGVSIGIAVSELGEATPDELLRQADVAMYVAKGRGKGRCEVFVPAMQQTIVERLALASDLQTAVERGEFVVYYQPVVAVADGRVVGMEALVRWQHPVRGLLPPHEFIPLAEDTGLIRPIGQWVLNDAVARVRGWQDRFPADRPLTIAVNVSVGQIRQPGLVDVVAEALESSGLPPDSLILEITESVVVEDADLALRRLRELKKLGVRLAIDDFGTGYSSLDRLRQFPVDFLKIDKSFIDKIRRRGKEHDLARTIIELGNNLGLEIVAEGIERPDQLARLRSLNCDLGQGYLFGRPMPADAMEAFLADADASLHIPARHAA